MNINAIGIILLFIPGTSFVFPANNERARIWLARCLPEIRDEAPGTNKRIIPIALMFIVATFGVAYAHEPAAPQDKGPFTLKKLADDTYALYGRGGNIGFAVTDEGVVVIDDQFADLAPGIADQIKSVTSKPVRFLINTHHHGDHTGGNGFFIKMTTIVAHDNVRKHMLEAPQEMIASAPGQIQNLEARIAKLEKDDPQSKDLAGLRLKSRMQRRVSKVPAR